MSVYNATTKRLLYITSLKQNVSMNNSVSYKYSITKWYYQTTLEQLW